MPEIQRRRKTAPVEEQKPPAVTSDPFFGKRHARTVVGIDPSATGTAIAFLDIDTGAHVAYRYKTKETGVRRLSGIRTFVKDRLMMAKLTSASIPHVCMEGYGFASQKGHTLGEVGGVIKVALLDALGTTSPAAYPTIVAPTTAKKFATGSGKGDKNQVLLAIYKRWGVEFADDNEADAFVLAQFAGGLAAPEYAAKMTAAMRESLAVPMMHTERPA